MSPQAPALRLASVTKRYGSVVAADSVSLAVAPGSITGLVGPNGSGKTTLLELACGLRTQDEGVVEIFGLPPSSLAAKRQFAFVPHVPSGYEELTVIEFVEFVVRLYGFDVDVDLVGALLTLFRLDGRAGVQLSSLSTGMRRQVSIVAATSLRPRLLLIDEASATLDPEAVVALREILSIVRDSGSAVLLATQDLTFAEKVCEDVHLLVNGAVVMAGNPSALCRRVGARSLEEALLHVIGVPSMSAEVRGAYAAR